MKNDNHPCVDFVSQTDDSVIANLTIFRTVHEGQDCHDIAPTFKLQDTCHQALIETLEAIWPDWYDYDQWMTKRRVESDKRNLEAETAQIEADAEAELVRQGMAY